MPHNAAQQPLATRRVACDSQPLARLSSAVARRCTSPLRDKRTAPSRSCAFISLNSREENSASRRSRGRLACEWRWKGGRKTNPSPGLGTSSRQGRLGDSLRATHLLSEQQAQWRVYHCIAFRIPIRACLLCELTNARGQACRGLDERQERKSAKESKRATKKKKKSKCKSKCSGKVRRKRPSKCRHRLYKRYIR